MKRLFSIAIISAFILPGCIVHSHRHPPRGRTVVREAPRNCGPAYHLEGGVCVHNGKAKGHHKHKHRR